MVAGYTLIEDLRRAVVDYGATVVQEHRQRHGDAAAAGTTTSGGDMASEGVEGVKNGDVVAATTTTTPMSLSAADLSEPVAIFEDGASAELQRRRRQLTAVIVNLRRAVRSAAKKQRDFKADTALARAEMDRAYVELQNLLYQQRHLEAELEQCADFQTIYDKVPLIDVDVFRMHASAEVRDLESSDPHAFMLKRLEFECEERKRLMTMYDAEEAKRKQLVEELKKQKEKVDKIENQFDVLAKVSRSLQLLTGYGVTVEPVAATNGNDDKQDSDSDDKLDNERASAVSSTAGDDAEDNRDTRDRREDSRASTGGDSEMGEIPADDRITVVSGHVSARVHSAVSSHASDGDRRGGERDPEQSMTMTVDKQ